MAEKVKEAFDKVVPKPKPATPKAKTSKQKLEEMIAYAIGEINHVVDSTYAEEDENRRITKFMKHADNIAWYADRVEKLRKAAEML